MEKEIMENNILIAEFMGWEKDMVHKTHGQLYRHPATMGLKWDFNFHDSWDWLMPCWAKVVEVIGLWMSCHENIGISKAWLEASEKIQQAVMRVDIKSAHQQIANLIKWHNSSNQNPEG